MFSIAAIGVAFTIQAATVFVKPEIQLELNQNTNILLSTTFEKKKTIEYLKTDIGFTATTDDHLVRLSLKTPIDDFGSQTEGRIDYLKNGF